MAKYRGTLRKSDLEGGIWQLVADDGATYVLDSASLGAEGDVTLVDGVRVVIEGDVDRQTLSFAMAGPLLKARSIKGA
ncbi:MAG: hypothetical protein ABUL77_03335 [Bacteroidota bacterium]